MSRFLIIQQNLILLRVLIIQQNLILLCVLIIFLHLIICLMQHFQQLIFFIVFSIKNYSKTNTNFLKIKNEQYKNWIIWYIDIILLYCSKSKHTNLYKKSFLIYNSITKYIFEFKKEWKNFTKIESKIFELIFLNLSHVDCLLQKLIQINIKLI